MSIFFEYDIILWNAFACEISTDRGRHNKIETFTAPQIPMLVNASLLSVIYSSSLLSAVLQGSGVINGSM